MGDRPREGDAREEGDAPSSFFDNDPDLFFGGIGEPMPHIGFCSVVA